MHRGYVEMADSWKHQLYMKIFATTHKQLCNRNKGTLDDQKI